MAPFDSKANPLDHDLEKHFPELLKFESTPEMERSALWAEIRPEVERIMGAVVVENLSIADPSIADRGLRNADFLQPDDVDNHDGAVDSQNPQSAIRNPQSKDPQSVSALAWNIERGNIFEGIVDALQNHDDLKDKDLLLLTELDYGMARSGNRFVAREIAERLNLNYAFAPVYIALQKGSGVESESEGENTKSIHGLAMFSKWPMKNVHAVPLPNGKDKMWGKEKRLGYLQALVADIEHPTGTFRAVTVHLDAHCSRAHRHLQMKIILDHVDTLAPMPTVIGGDWNTTTFNAQSATRAILGYWRRVMMGVKNVVKNHYPHPDRYFERGLFGELEKRGYEYKSLNELGAGTIHYDVSSIEKNTNLRDWVPEWCFPFIFWAANRVGGRVSGRLDWFTGRGIKAASEPKTIGHLVNDEGTPLSDHDAITVDFEIL
ncbi:MAG TPA: endonuclease/exonuclease/phosphatase family protein [Pyrinomonadaceae bacterium]|nr:endonuclease/exonuclease/phosphatase family protein [Pyrinomonadaceae bacterium]